MTQPFEGKSVLVTGGSRGIGRAIATRFAKDGAAKVAIGYLRNDRAAEETAAEIEELGTRVTLVRGNISSTKVADQVAALGPLDVLVHNAATGVARPALETEDKHFDWTMSANARALIALARVAAPAMPEGSSIVALSSLGSERVLDNYVLVGASKAALEAIVRYLAVELAPRGIRVNAVSAGVVETDALEAFPNREQMLSWSVARTPAGKLVTPEDVAAAVSFLCSPGRGDDPRPDPRRRRGVLAVGLAALAHEALPCGRHQRHRLGEEHPHRVSKGDRLLVDGSRRLDPAERRRRQVDSRIERQRRELLALCVGDRLRLLLRELAQPTQEIVGIAAEREAEAAFFHAGRVSAGDQPSGTL